MKKRIIFDLVLLGSVFYTPWWIIGMLAFIGAFLFPLFYEIIILGILVDILYGGPSLPLSGTYGILASIIIFLVATYTRKAVR